MDPTTNPTPTPTPPAGGAAGPAPVTPAAPAAPASPVAPDTAGATPAAPAAPAAAAPAAPGVAPVNPVINPGAGATNPVFQSTGGVGMAATDPIMVPEAPAPPDPVEEELKAPMKAADPVPGSIGSAVSGPDDGKGTSAADGDAPAQNPFETKTPQTPSVAFNDPAEQPDAGTAPADAKPAKKKTNKTTLIALAVVLALVVVGLGVFLFLQMNNGGDNSQQTSNNQPAAPVAEVDDEKEKEIIDDDEITDSTPGVICTYSKTDTESGVTTEASMKVNIVDNVIKSVDVATTESAPDASGNITEVDEYSNSESYTYEELLKSSGVDTTAEDEYVGAGGVLKVDTKVFATYFENFVNEVPEMKNAGIVFTCKVS